MAVQRKKKLLDVITVLVESGIEYRDCKIEINYDNPQLKSEMLLYDLKDSIQQIEECAEIISTYCINVYDYDFKRRILIYEGRRKFGWNYMVDGHAVNNLKNLIKVFRLNGVHAKRISKLIMHNKKVGL